MASVNIFVCTYGELATKLTNNFLLSLSRSVYKDFKVFLSSSGQFCPEIDQNFEYMIGFKHHFETQKHFPEQIKFLYEKADQDCKWVLLCNDDVMLNKDCLGSMIKTLEQVQTPLLIEPLSNCDNGKLYIHPIAIKDGETLTVLSQLHYGFDEIEPVKDRLINGEMLFKMPGIQFVEWVAFYCAMISKENYDLVGGIDPIFKTGKDDLDFSIRAAQKGIQSAVCTDAFCFHYAGITSTKVITSDDRKFNEDYFNEKYKTLKE